ncbi:TIGR03086 family metal-binding protein [Micromonospora echinofusca]|uniref:TIGR03086 family protein n=1 Tax=Micromonospora echinofusca TaxID=47858 RepID=A0ABS3VKV7_MICEH|nr:TIGR03086 family metal-binding protein [Micromonospora echinofusca]MBO4205155.1 TIGR03086 family protein [Micromonospora echinofusca]
MTTRISELLGAAAPRAVAVVRGITDDQLDLPTPCSEFAVRGLLGHLFEVVVNFQGLARKEQVGWGFGADLLGSPDWRDRFATETDRAITAWSEPSALEGVSPMGMPQPMLGNLVVLDLTVHAWDLARSTGQSFEPAPDVLSELHDVVVKLAPTARERGVFGAEVPVPADAPVFDRLLGTAGRDPGWGPPSAG